MNIDYFKILLNLLITMFFYMIIPLAMRIINGNYDKKEANRIAFYNSIAVCFGFLVLKIAKNNSISETTINFFPAIFYYWINCFVLTFNKSKRKVKKIKQEKDKEKPQKEEWLYEEKKTKNKKIKKDMYCKKCGGKLGSNKECTKCGKKYFHITKKIIVYILIFIVLTFSIIFNIMQYSYLKSKKDNNQTETKKMKKKINNLKEEIKDLENRNLDLIDEKLEYEEKANFLDENIVFVIEGYGNYYYTYDCVQKITAGEYNYWAYNKDAAIYNGYIKGICN